MMADLGVTNFGLNLHHAGGGVRYTVTQLTARLIPAQQSDTCPHTVGTARYTIQKNNNISVIIIDQWPAKIIASNLIS